MPTSCTPRQECALTATRPSVTFAPAKFLLGLAVSALIWASLAMGTMLTLT